MDNFALSLKVRRACGCRRGCETGLPPLNFSCRQGLLIFSDLDLGHTHRAQFNCGFRRRRFRLFRFGKCLLWRERCGGFHSQYRPRGRRIGNDIPIAKKNEIGGGFAYISDQPFPFRQSFIWADDLDHSASLFCIVTLLVKAVKHG